MRKRPQSISINLLPYNQDREKIKQMAIFFGLAFLVMIGAMTGVYYLQHQQLVALQTEQQQLQSTLVGLTGIPVDATEANKVKQQLQGLSTKVNGLKANRRSATPLLEDIQTNIPNQVNIVTLEVKGTGIVLEGQADNYGYVADFVASLLTNSRFKNLKLVKAGLDDNQMLNFTLEMEWGEVSR